MTPLYHLTVLPPKIPQAEALSQEIGALQTHFGGQISYLNPNHHSWLYWPRLAFGFQRYKTLRQQDTRFDLHHVYNPDPFPFPILRRFHRPVVYTISSGVDARRPNVGYFSKLGAVAVADERSQKQLRMWGIENSFLVRPGVDTARFHYQPCPLQKDIRLMVASAPWTMAQFRSKGVDALLKAAQQAPYLRLIFLWRGVLTDEMTSRIQAMGLSQQVTVIDKLTDVNAILTNVHAAITLADKPGIIKSYPHSLLDSLAAGKPVLVSQAIPMADYVTETGCGVVVSSVTPNAILEAIEALRQQYNLAQTIALQVGQRDFSQQAMIASYQQVYEQVLQTA